MVSVLASLCDNSIITPMVNKVRSFFRNSLTIGNIDHLRILPARSSLYQRHLLWNGAKFLILRSEIKDQSNHSRSASTNRAPTLNSALVSSKENFII